MEQVKKTFLFSIISCVTMLIPVLTLIWNAAKLSAKVDEHEKRIISLETSYQKDINDIKNALANINISLAELRVSIHLMNDGGQK